MTTLLDLKSSVLRQVQRSQSLRSRREPPPTAGSPLTHCPEPLPRRVATCCEQAAHKLPLPEGHINDTITCTVRL